MNNMLFGDVAHTFISSEENSKMRAGLVVLGDVGEG